MLVLWSIFIHNILCPRGETVRSFAVTFKTCERIFFDVRHIRRSAANRAVPARDSAQYRQPDPALRQRRQPPAPGAAAGVRAGRPAPQAGRAGSLRARSIPDHDDLDAAIGTLGPRRWLVVETSGATRYDRVEYRADDVLLFGPETRGLPDEVLDRFAVEDRVMIPQRSEARSLNLSNAAAIVFYEAWRQLSFR